MHYYEGYGVEEITYPVRVARILGAEKLIVTNAAGGVNGDFEVGDIMLICDHIKLFGDSPLRGKNIDTFGVRFPDMTYAYSKRLRDIA
ncbi:purine-nucleoside phosphorylase, partial [Escherichia coli]